MIMKLLTLNSAKLNKAASFGYENAALYLSPADISGQEFCSHRTNGCTHGCLNTSGHGGMSKFKGWVTYNILKSNSFSAQTSVVQIARLKRSRQLINDRKWFINLLLADCKLLAKRATKVSRSPAVRFNGTSDLDWNALAISVGVDLPKELDNLGIIRYEYTKVPRRWKQTNVHWTFSLSEHPKSEEWAVEYLKEGYNVAIVFKTPPTSYSIGNREYAVIDGDQHDLRFLDPKGCIVGLKAKGWAKHDTTGFVR